eukprot:NODE_260_length_12610_cov_0.413076.p8 type:complete len:144 gc:universal NODE_260_length_12610_cov_0.413076:5635-5204(-)
MKFPSVQILLKQYNINSAAVSPSGPKNSLLKGDVLKYIASNKLKPVEVKLQASLVKYANIVKWGKISIATVDTIQKQLKTKVELQYKPILFADAPLSISIDDGFSALVENKLISYEYPQDYQTRLKVDEKYANELVRLLDANK